MLTAATAPAAYAARGGPCRLFRSSSAAMIAVLYLTFRSAYGIHNKVMYMEHSNPAMQPIEAKVTRVVAVVFAECVFTI